MASDLSGIGRALERVNNELHVDPLLDPHRATAIVADLVGHPQTARIEDIQALRVTLVELAEHADAENRSVDGDRVLSAIVSNGIERPSAMRMFDTAVEAIGLSPTQAPKRRNIGLIAAGVGLMLLIVGFVVLTNNPLDPTVAPSTTFPSATEASPTTEAGPPTTAGDTTTTSTIEPTDPATGLTATFETVREGAFDVTRGWRVTPNQAEFVGITQLAGVDGLAASGSHRELPPPGPVPTAIGLEWVMPKPAVVVNTTAVFNIALEAGQSVQIEYRTTLNADTPLTEDDVLSWFEEWRPLAEEIRSTLGSTDTLLEPVVRVSTE